MKNAAVIDAASGKVYSGQVVKIVDGVIASVEAAGSPAQLKALEHEASRQGLVVADLDGLYLCPGLIDAHVHVTGAYVRLETPYGACPADPLLVS